MARQTELPLVERITLFADATRRALDATEGSPVRLGIENHGRQGNDPAWMDGVLQRVNSPRLGLTLDVGNWYWFGHPLSHVYEIYRKYGPRTVHTHVKSIRYPAEMREQDSLRAGQQFEVERIHPGEYRLKRIPDAGQPGLLQWLLACPEKGWFQRIPSDSTADL